MNGAENKKTPEVIWNGVKKSNSFKEVSSLTVRGGHDFKESIRPLVSELYKKGGLEFMQRVSEFAKDMEPYFPEARDCEYFHVLICSTPELRKNGHWLAADMIEMFIQKEAKRHGLVK